jgi:uncharacterized membrane protein YsdA (DUF1294 family)
MPRSHSPNRNPIGIQVGLTLLAFAAALLLTIECGIHPIWSYLLSINLTTFLAYAYDKWSAPRDGRRIPERTLHLLAAAGGTPAALAGQLLLRHKNRKRSFQIRFWIIVAGQILILLAWMWFSGRLSRSRLAVASPFTPLFHRAGSVLSQPRNSLSTGVSSSSTIGVMNRANSVM